MNGGKILKNESFAQVKKVSKIKKTETKENTETEKKDTKDKTFISNETTKEIVRLLTNDKMKEYSKFINDTFPVETTTMHVNKPISYYLGKS